MSARYLVARGRNTALRLLLPPLESLTIGSSPTADVRLEEPGVAPEHALLFLDHGVGLDVRDPETARLVDDGRGDLTEEPLRVGQTVDLAPGDRLRIGSVELLLLTAEAEASGAHAVPRAFFERRLAELAQADERPALSVVRLRTPGGRDPEAITLALLEVVRPTDLVAELGAGEHGVLLTEVTEGGGRKLVAELAQALEARGLEVLLGVAQGTEDRPGRLLELAGERMARPAHGGGSPRALVAKDPETQRVARLVERVAKGRGPVLILGETGAGKDLVAQLIHDRSERAGGPFLRVGCVGLPESVFEDGAAALLARARGGTVHFDEVGGLSQRAQLALGYLLDDGPSSGADVRFLASSNQDLAAAVESGAFRKDLYFRLNQLTVEVPALRERPADIVPLAELFIDATRSGGAAPRLTAAAKVALEGYGWPGNVRELKSVVERAILSSGGEELGMEHLPPEVTGAAPRPRAPREVEAVAGPAVAGSAGKPSLRDELAALEKRRILEALEQYPTQREAAAALEMPMRTFLNRLDQFGIQRARGGGKRDQGDED